jgi:REP element-mobilizing transposase RayT
MTIPLVVGRFKMASSKRINAWRKTPGIPIWQRNYYEHVIRDENSLECIRAYIADNPARWAYDRENPAAAASGVKEKWEV